MMMGTIPVAAITGAGMADAVVNLSRSHRNQPDPCDAMVLFALEPVFTRHRETNAIRVFASLQDYREAGVTASGFVIGTTDSRQGRQLLFSLRAEKVSAALPIFLLHPLGPEIDAVSDGVINTVVEGCRLAAEIRNWLDKLPAEIETNHDSDIFNLLSFLYSRKNYVLEPHRHWSNRGYYAWPLIEALFGNVEEIETWLESLIRRKLLRPATLIDRIRHCPSCEGAHISFFDHCSSCSHIDISQKPFLHCFTCGHVAPEEAFLQEGTLSCPNCRTSLRHIGSDYDRPLENYACNSCGHIFIEPDVAARCMHCGTVSKPEDLAVRPVYALTLSEKGAMAAKTGSVEDVFALLDSLNNVNPSHFEGLVDWLLGLCRRHSDELFSLIGLRLTNILELTDNVGKRKVTELMDGLVTRIRELIRTTDLTTRSTRQTFWLMLPKTDAQGNGVVLGRLLELKDLTHQDNRVAIDFETVTYTAPDDMLPGETGKLLMARLEGELGE